MLRRFVIVGIVAAFAAPAFAITPVSANIEFSCTTGSGSATFAPGLGNTPAYQTDVSSSSFLSVTGCSNGETATIAVGAGAGFNTVASGPGAPNKMLTCTSGGDFPNNTVLLAGFADPSMGISWGLGGSTTGIAKFKAPGIGGRAKAVLVRTAGKYPPPAGHPAGSKTKIKFTFTTTPANGTCSDFNPTTLVSFGLVPGTNLIVQHN